MKIPSYWQSLGQFKPDAENRYCRKFGEAPSRSEGEVEKKEPEPVSELDALKEDVGNPEKLRERMIDKAKYLAETQVKFLQAYTKNMKAPAETRSLSCAQEEHMAVIREMEMLKIIADNFYEGCEKEGKEDFRNKTIGEITNILVPAGIRFEYEEAFDEKMRRIKGAPAAATVELMDKTEIESSVLDVKEKRIEMSEGEIKTLEMAQEYASNTPKERFKRSADEIVKYAKFNIEMYDYPAEEETEFAPPSEHLREMEWALAVDDRNFTNKEFTFREFSNTLLEMGVVVPFIGEFGKDTNRRYPIIPQMLTISRERNEFEELIEQKRKEVDVYSKRGGQVDKIRDSEEDIRSLEKAMLTRGFDKNERPGEVFTHRIFSLLRLLKRKDCDEKNPQVVAILEELKGLYSATNEAEHFQKMRLSRTIRDTETDFKKLGYNIEFGTAGKKAVVRLVPKRTRRKYIVRNP